MSKIDEWYDNALEFYEKERNMQITTEAIQCFTARFYELSVKEELNNEEIKEFEDIISIFIMYEKLPLLDISKITSKNNVIFLNIVEEFEKE